ncbi:MAG TPA: hypothetical protein VNT30_21380 [Stellaceae bacterium]|nr:hypothetical protein [Stellaceae bacterium]
MRDVEHGYVFSTVEQLIEDFFADVVAAGGQL